MALDFAFRLPRLLKTRVSNFIANSKARTGAPRPAMDRIIYNLPDSPWKETLVTVGLSAIIYCSWAFLLRGKELPPVDFNIPLPEQCDPDFAEAIQYPFQLRALGDEESGEPKPWEVVDQDGDHINSWCPADGRRLGFWIKPKDTNSIDTAVRRAKNAQQEWAKSTFVQRRRVLRTLLKYLLEYQEEIVRVCCLDSGKTRVDALFGEILVTAEKLQWTIDHGEKALTPTKRPTNLLMFYKSNTVIYEPLGVVAACVSWNYPFHNFISPIISAIFAGNAIVVKPSEQTAWSSVYFTNIVKGAIAQCGHSQNIVQTVVCLPEAANHLTSHPDISHITFIGSRNVALEVCKSAAKSLTPVTVELGGKDPAVILDDKKTVKDLPGITSILMRGVFQSAGQNCIGIERVIALPGVYDRLIKIVLPLIKAMRLGSVLIDEYYVIDDPENVDYKSEIENKTEGQEKGEPFGENPQQEGGDNDNDNEQEPAEPPPPRLFTTWANTDMGAMINSNNFSTLELLISKAVSQGARLLTGGTRYAHPTYPWGSYFSPTLLADVTPDMEIAQTEVFGPIFLLMKAEDVTQAIDIANSTPYALGAGVFGRNKKDVEKCVSEIKAGMVSVNDFGSFYATQLPFGGVKGSGYGRFAGEEGLRAVCNIKSISRDRWPGLIQTRIPELLDYPLRDSWEAWEMVQGIVEMGYAPWKGKVAGVKRMLSAMKRAWKIPKVTLEAVVIEETREDDPDKQDDDDEDGKGSEEAVVVEKAVDLDAVD